MYSDGRAEDEGVGQVYDDKLGGQSESHTRRDQADSVPQFLQPEEDVAQAVVVREQLDLARAVEQDVVVAQRRQALLEPLDVVLQLLERVQHAAVGAQLLLLHGLVGRTTRSRTSSAHGYGVASLAGSRFTTAHGRSTAAMNWCMPWQYVDLPDPGAPSTS